jgi:hypothetical protein
MNLLSGNTRKSLFLLAIGAAIGFSLLARHNLRDTQPAQASDAILQAVSETPSPTTERAGPRPSLILRTARASAARESPLPVAREYENSTDLSAFYTKYSAAGRGALDPETKYFIAQALEDCYALSHAGWESAKDAFQQNTLPLDSPIKLYRQQAFETSLQNCRGFDGKLINIAEIMTLLREAAESGEPRALARSLLFKDFAESKFESFELVKRLLATRDPYVIRDVGAYLSRGEDVWLMGDNDQPVPVRVMAVAWELVACDFGLDCGASSRLVQNQCALSGHCGVASYEDWLRQYGEPASRYREIMRIRGEISAALQTQNWELLGFNEHYLLSRNLAVRPER